MLLLLHKLFLLDTYINFFFVYRDIKFQLQKEKVVNALKANVPTCFLSFFKASLIEKRQYDVLSMLDQGNHTHILLLVVSQVFHLPGSG